MNVRNYWSIWLIFFCGSLYSQSPLSKNALEEKLPRISQSLYIENAMIKAHPEQASFRGSILIENGLIQAVGIGLKPSPEAIILKGDSLFVYAGFISGLSHAGIPDKKDKRTKAQQSTVKDPGKPENSTAGITPGWLLYDKLDPKDKHIVELRQLGFTAVHSVPRGQMMPGQGAFILLSGESKDAIYIKDSRSLYAQFKGSGRMYPSTIIAVIAKWKELFHQSKLAQQHENTYQLNPLGMDRPKYSAAVRALYPVVNKELPVIFNTPKILDIYRALQLQADLPFSLILANIKQGWPAMTNIKEKNIPIFLSLDLPEDEKAKKSKQKVSPSEAEKMSKTKTDLKDTSKVQEKEKKEKIKTKEQKEFEIRKQESLEAYQSQAARFEEAGVEFGFSTIGVKSSEIKTHLSTMIAKGLSEDQALASLTTYPARIFGLANSMGTLEPGKMANLVLTNKPIFSKEAKIRYVIIEGKKFEFDKQAEKQKEKDKKEF